MTLSGKKMKQVKAWAWQSKSDGVLAHTLAENGYPTVHTAATRAEARQQGVDSNLWKIVRVLISVKP